jgi:hypothetical protein
MGAQREEEKSFVPRVPGIVSFAADVFKILKE